MAGEIKNPRSVFGELRIGVEAGTAQEHADGLNASLKTVLGWKLENESEELEKNTVFGSIKKIHAPDSNTVAIMACHEMPKQFKKIPEDILIKLRHAGQSVNFEVDLGTSPEELLNDDAPIIE
jgi:hypothetical protein